MQTLSVESVSIRANNWKCKAWPWIHSCAPVREPALSRRKPLKRKLQVGKLLNPSEMEERQPRLPQTKPISNPRAVHNGAALAYLGDAVFELYVRRHFFTPAQTMDKYNGCVMAVACCEAQDLLLQDLLKGSFLTQEEREVIKWGKNVVTAHSRATKRAGTAVYSSATGFETLIGFLYLSNMRRLDELMVRLGFNKDPEQDASALLSERYRVQQLSTQETPETKTNS